MKLTFPAWHIHGGAGTFFMPNCILLHLRKHSLSNKDGKRDRSRERNWWQSVGIVPPVYNNISLPSWPSWVFLLDVALHKLYIPCYFFFSFVFSCAVPSNRNTLMQCLSGVPSLDFSLQTALHACLGTGWHRQQPDWRAQWQIPRDPRNRGFYLAWVGELKHKEYCCSKRIIKHTRVVSVGTYSAIFWCDVCFTNVGALWCVLKANISVQMLWKCSHYVYLWMYSMAITRLLIRFP